MIKKPETKIEWFLLTIFIITALAVVLVIIAGTFHILGL